MSVHLSISSPLDFIRLILKLLDLVQKTQRTMKGRKRPKIVVYLTIKIYIIHIEYVLGLRYSYRTI